jgi:hypothetical protein
MTLYRKKEKKIIFYLNFNKILLALIKFFFLRNILKKKFFSKKQEISNSYLDFLLI